MLKRAGVAGSLVAIAVLAVSSAVPAAGHGGGGDGGRGDRIRVLSTNTEEEFVDVGASGLSLGDEFIFTSDLTKHGRLVGHTGVVCTVTSTAREESQCVGTASLRRGQITIQGLVAGEPDVFEFPITGGSGDYEGAEGTLVVKEIPGSDPTQELLTFYLSD
jgi:hypothetical protein